MEKFRKYKICLYVDEFPTYSETFVIDKFIMLMEQGFEVVVIADKRGTFEQVLRDKLGNLSNYKEKFYYAPNTLIETFLCCINKFVKYPLSMLKFSFYNIIVSDNRYLTFIEKFQKRVALIGIQADVISVEFDSLAIRLCDLSHILGFKLVVSIRGVAQCTNSFYKNKGLFEYISKYLCGVICMTQFLKENALLIGYSKDLPFFVVYAGVDPLFISKKISTYKDKNVFRVTSIGRVAWSKGYEYALEAIYLLSKQGIKINYTIVGEGPHWDAAQLAAEDFGLLDKDIVHFVGVKSPKEVKKILHETDVLLQASIIEGFGISTIEAQAMGVPVVGTKVGGLPEAIEDSITGYLVTKRDPQKLSQKLMYLYKHENIRKEMGEKARNRVEKCFTRTAEMNELKKVYSFILNLD